LPGSNGLSKDYPDMAFIDHRAADEIRRLREDAGYNSAEQLAAAIRLAAPKAPWGKRGTVDAWTIRKVEEGHVPGPRIRTVLAGYFGLAQRDVWQPRNWQVVEVSIATANKRAAA
jgi:hypothetical protein